MTQKLFQKIVDSGDSVIEYVITHYWEMDKEDLRDCVSEIGWVATRSLDDEDAKAFNHEVLESIAENRLDEE